VRRSQTRPRRCARARSALLCAITAAVLGTGAAASSAFADAIVYVKDGNLFLTSPDGARGYQLTTDGGYGSPSQADDGTIGALHGKQLVRLTRGGQLRNAPIEAMGSRYNPNIGGPYEPRISPDGTKFAYYFYVQSSFTDYGSNVVWTTTGASGAWTWADHFTNPASESDYARELVQPEWLSNDRLLGAQGFWMNMWTWKIGTGHGYTFNAMQWWFGLQDPPNADGVEVYHWYEDPALSRDGTKLAMTDGDGASSRLLIAATHGPAWSGEPPYPEPDYVGGTSVLARPTIVCSLAPGTVLNPTWSADGHQLAYGAADGVHVVSVPDSLDCGQMTDRLVIPGGKEPAFGPADVDPSQAPDGPARGPASSGPARPPAAAAITRLSARPRAFRPARRGRGGTVLRFTLPSAGRVTLTARTTAGRRVRGRLVIRGRAGANRVRFSGRLGGRRMRPGRYVLTLTSAAGARARLAVRVLR